MELYRFPLVFHAQWQSSGCSLPGWRRLLNVYRDYHSDHTRARPARRLQRRRRRSDLRHGILWRRRPWPDYRDPADFAPDGQAVSTEPKDRGADSGNESAPFHLAWSGEAG